ncbi:MAG: putative Ig domain-containing protein [Fuerstiella sp.]
MDDKNRTKILAAVLAVVLGFGLFRPDQKLMEPIRRAEADLEIAVRDFEKEEVKQMELLVARNRISQGRDNSLPPRATDAQRLYQTWITNLAEQCRFAQLQVTPGNKGNMQGQYVTVDVIVEAETDLAGLSRFLYLFEQAELMHRIAQLEIESTGATGTPRLEVKLTAEGMSVAGSPPRSDVFARTSLPKPVTASDTEITVAEAADFPRQTPFLAQVGREMVRVTAADGNTWTVERGQEGTTPAEHPVDQVVQSFPVAITRRDVSFASYEPLLNASPFVKPTPPKVYSPRLAGIVDKTIAPGETVEVTARAEDIDPDVGSPLFALDNSIEGMTIDPETGAFKWETPGDIEPKRYETKFILTQKNSDLRIEKTLGITVQLPNEEPTITVPDRALVVLGREFTLEASAQDDQGDDALRFSLDGTVPEGLAIDEATGRLKWTPPRTFVPGDYTVTVKVTDGGNPPKAATAPLTLTVVDDEAEMTKFTGSVALDGQQVAWFRNMASKQRPQLRVGDRVRAADIDAELIEIDKRHVLMKDAEGVWKLMLGNNLRQRVLIEPAAAPETTEDAAAADGAASGPDGKANGDKYDADPPAESPQEEPVDQPAEKPAEPTTPAEPAASAES